MVALVGYQSQEMKGVGIRRRMAQYLFINGSRVLQIAGAVKVQAGSESAGIRLW